MLQLAAIPVDRLNIMTRHRQGRQRQMLLEQAKAFRHPHPHPRPGVLQRRESGGGEEVWVAGGAVHTSAARSATTAAAVRAAPCAAHMARVRLTCCSSGFMPVAAPTRRGRA
eukprot:363385-Chlamydomonas_euryale.AAC.1